VAVRSVADQLDLFAISTTQAHLASAGR